jgi:hypothetical protein
MREMDINHNEVDPILFEQADYRFIGVVHLHEWQSTNNHGVVPINRITLSFRSLISFTKKLAVFKVGDEGGSYLLYSQYIFIKLIEKMVQLIMISHVEIIETLMIQISRRKKDIKRHNFCKWITALHFPMVME